MNSTKCLNITLVDDDLVEGSETLYLSLEVVAGSSRGIRLVEPNTTTIEIADVNCEYVCVSTCVCTCVVCVRVWCVVLILTNHIHIPCVA